MRKYADQMFIRDDPTQSNKVPKRENVSWSSNNVWSCLITKHFPIGLKSTIFDEMSDVAQILLNTIKRVPSSKIKVGAQNGWLLSYKMFDRVWSSSIIVLLVFNKERGVAIRLEIDFE